jgi:hypothetical protein
MFMVYTILSTDVFEIHHFLPMTMILKVFRRVRMETTPATNRLTMLSILHHGTLTQTLLERRIALIHIHPMYPSYNMPS